jgi:hypothetical protein
VSAFPPSTPSKPVDKGCGQIKTHAVHTSKLRNPLEMALTTMASCLPYTIRKRVSEWSNWLNIHWLVHSSDTTVSTRERCFQDGVSNSLTRAAGFHRGRQKCPDPHNARQENRRGQGDNSHSQHLTSPRSPQPDKWVFQAIPIGGSATPKRGNMCQGLERLFYLIFTIIFPFPIFSQTSILLPPASYTHGAQEMSSAVKNQT